MGGCIIWTGHIDKDGYGKVGNVRAHRIAYENVCGPIPVGLTIDHLCRVRACVNPDHLEAVTRRENTIRGNGPSALNARKTACVNGHPFDEANTYFATTFDSTGAPKARRGCRACNLSSVNRYKDKRRQGARA